MSRIVQSFPTLTGGVSQQAEALRLPEQAQDQRNACPSIIEGLRKRNGSERISELLTPFSGTTNIQFIDRDEDEQYFAFFADVSSAQDQALKVYRNSDGSSLTLRDINGDIATSSDLSYLACDDPTVDIETLTLKDYTFVLNKKIQPALLSGTSPSSIEEGLISVNAGNYMTDYVVRVYTPDASVDLTVKVTTNTSENVAYSQYIKTTYITEQIKEALTGDTSIEDLAGSASVTLTGTPLTASAWDITSESNTIHLKRSAAYMAANPGDDAFFLEGEDSVGSTNLSIIKESVSTFSELPLVAPNGFVIKIDGDVETAGGEYYAKFTTKDENEDFGPGTWSESLAEGIQYQIDPETMPHALVRLSNGEFLFAPLDGTTYTDIGVTDVELPSWKDREVGDEDSNPAPSFIGKELKSIFFFKDRLGLLTDERVVLSTAGDYFSFWRETVVDLLDTARIDVGAQTTEVIQLNRAVPLGEQLILFSDRVQFSLRGENVLTPKTVSISPVSRIEVNTIIEPAVIGNSIFMPDKRGDYSVLRELVDTSQTRPKLDVLDIMVALPSYASGTIQEISKAKSDDKVVFFTDGATKELVVYDFLVNAGSRIQSAFSKYTFEGDILHVSFTPGFMNIILDRNDEVALERINIEPFNTELGKDYPVLLDRRVTDAECSVSYDGSTTVTLPYTVATSSMSLVTGEGVLHTPISATGTEVKFSADLTAETFFIGENFEMLYEFSRINLRAPSQQGGVVPVITGEHNLTYGHLVYEDSAAFDVCVSSGNYESVYEFNGNALGLNSLIGSLNLDSGVFDFGIFGQPKDVRIVIKNQKPYPCRLIAAEIEATYRQRGRRF